MALVPLVCAVLALSATLSDVESANLKLHPSSEEKVDIVELRHHGNNDFIAHMI